MSCIIIQLICNNKQKQYNFASSSLAKIEVWGKNPKKVNRSNPDSRQTLSEESQLKMPSFLKEVFCYFIASGNRCVLTTLELEKCLHWIIFLYEV